jgi:hypothetical protein
MLLLQIDFEFLNGNPGVPGSLWTNRWASSAAEAAAAAAITSNA